MLPEDNVSAEKRAELMKLCEQLKEDAVLNMNPAETKVRLANIHLKLGEREEAMFALQGALKLKPGNPAILSRLKQICSEEEFAKLEIPQEVKPFWHDIPGLIKYPMSGSGIFLLIGGSIFVTLVQFIVSLPTIFFYGSMSLGIFLAGYLCAYFISVMKSSARGRTTPPDWPDITGILGNVFHSLWIVSFPAVLSFFPALLYLFPLLLYHTSILTLIALIAIGMLYYPMALVASSITGRAMNAANFVGVIASISKIRGDYIIALIILAFLSGVSFLAYLVVGSITGALAGSIIASFALQFVYLYFLMIYAHILGLLYRQYETRIT